MTKNYNSSNESNKCGHDGCGKEKDSTNYANQNKNKSTNSYNSNKNKTSNSTNSKTSNYTDNY